MCVFNKSWDRYHPFDKKENVGHRLCELSYFNKTSFYKRVFSVNNSIHIPTNNYLLGDFI